MFENVFLRNEMCFVLLVTLFMVLCIFSIFVVFFDTFDFVIDLTVKTIDTKRNTVGICHYWWLLFNNIMLLRQLQTTTQFLRRSASITWEFQVTQPWKGDSYLLQLNMKNQLHVMQWVGSPKKN